MSKLHKGKACGPDELCAEHLLYAHPCLVVHLKLLFSSIFSHGTVPDDFGAGIIVPLIKDKTGNIGDISNYRPITLISIISKLLECILLEICAAQLEVDDLQFGFKRGHSCADAIFALKSTINYFTERGSCIYAAALDLSKAFDTVNHYKLFSTLLKAGIPRSVINIICDWYGKLFVCVRWNGSLSDIFQVCSGVRQGSTLSPALFNLFINIFIVNLKLGDIGCHIHDIYYGRFVYADDIIILCPSVQGLQTMLDICAKTSDMLHLQFNISKSHCIMFGKCSKVSIEPMFLNRQCIHWVPSINYLGCYLVSGKTLSFDISHVKRSFFAACNCIFAHASNLDEIVHLSLQESYCLPILTYASAALSLSVRQLNELNVCWNTVYRMILHFNRWESVKSFINGLGRLNLIYIFKVSRVRFYHHLINACNPVLYNMLWVYFADNHSNDICLNSLLLNKNAAVSSLYEQFGAICS
jgi:hypothetical protein